MEMTVEEIEAWYIADTETVASYAIQGSGVDSGASSEEASHITRKRKYH